MVKIETKVKISLLSMEEKTNTQARSGKAANEEAVFVPNL